MTWRILVGDVREQLARLPAGVAQTCVTSPPYWGLRDYGTAAWEGGDPVCDHMGPPFRTKASINVNCGTGTDRKNTEAREPMGARCSKCGAARVDAQIGLEATPDLYVAGLVEVFRAVRRVLADDGTLWLNLGDSYAGGGTGRRDTIGEYADRRAAQYGSGRGAGNGPHDYSQRDVPAGLKSKDLVGIPWRVAFALQADGWYLRSDIIWAKPNPMPESVTDRPTKAHEYLFLLTKAARYYYDADAIREPHSDQGDRRRIVQAATGWASPQKNSGAIHLGAHDAGRNKRSVWTVATQPSPEAHFATFPEALIEPCILAGSRPAGRHCDCDEVIGTPLGTGAIDDRSLELGRAGFNRPRRADEGTRPITRHAQRHYAAQLRESPHRAAMATDAGDAFEHYTRTDASGARPIPPALLEAWRAAGWLVDPPPTCDCGERPADTVLDPFTGSGTTGAVAVRHGRNYLGVELNPAYVALARTRIGSVAPLFAQECIA